MREVKSGECIEVVVLEPLGMYDIKSGECMLDWSHSACVR